MPKVDFGARRKEAEASGVLGGGDRFKLKDGDNRIRLMSECLPHQGEYNGVPNFKWLCYVLDRRDGGLKAFFMAHKIYKQIEALQVNPDYAFSDVPMPYDLTISVKNAGKKEAEYTLIPARKETPLSEEEIDALAEAKPIADVQKAMREKKAKEDAEKTENELPANELDGEPVPF
jgi:hypothetical protein